MATCVKGLLMWFYNMHIHDCEIIWGMMHKRQKLSYTIGLELLNLLLYSIKSHAWSAKHNLCELAKLCYIRQTSHGSRTSWIKLRVKPLYLVGKTHFVSLRFHINLILNPLLPILSMNMILLSVCYSIKW